MGRLELGYEYYPTLPDNGKPWRVFTVIHDDYVTRFATKQEAESYCANDEVPNP